MNSRSEALKILSAFPEFKRAISLVEMAPPYRIPKGFLSWETLSVPNLTAQEKIQVTKRFGLIQPGANLVKS